ncbi:AI-2E family transporter [Thermoleophilia bacterium SCSIO 60948]|nr:AI-2E family transporter [Thermoleophilia bacterium SCSIO 60948]
MPTLRGRRRKRPGPEGEGQAEEQFVIDADGLAGVFAAPRWLRDAGFTSWMLVGVTLLIVGLVWLMSLTHVIVLPVLLASVIAAVAGQPVTWMARHGVPRAVGALLVLVAIIALGALAGYLILNGVADEASTISSHLESAVGEIKSGLESLGFSSGKAGQAGSDLSSGASDSFHALLGGIARSISALSSIVFFLAMTILSLVFLLKDGPSIRNWAERHMGVPPAAARSITGRTLQSLRGYFFGVTIIAVFNAVLVGGGALLLGVPMPGTIAVVTFLGGYIPYLGAWSAGAFSVLIALGGSSPEAATGMIVIQILSNGPLQQIVQPIAYGAALGLHPLAVLITTIAGGALFGAVGLILAAPLTAAAVRISADLDRSRQAKKGSPEASESSTSPEPPAAADPNPA